MNKAKFYYRIFRFFEKETLYVLVGIPIGCLVNIFWSNFNLYYYILMGLISLVIIFVMKLGKVISQLKVNFEARTSANRMLYEADQKLPLKNAEENFKDTLDFQPEKRYRLVLLCFPTLIPLFWGACLFLLFLAHKLDVANAKDIEKIEYEQKLKNEDSRAEMLLVDKTHLQDSIKYLNNEIHAFEDGAKGNIFLRHKVKHSVQLHSPIGLSTTN